MRYWLLQGRAPEGPYTPEALVALPHFDPGLMICPEDKPTAERSNWAPARKLPEVLEAIRTRPTSTTPQAPPGSAPMAPIPILDPFHPVAAPQPAPSLQPAMTPRPILSPEGTPAPQTAPAPGIPTIPAAAPAAAPASAPAAPQPTAAAGDRKSLILAVAVAVLASVGLLAGLYSWNARNTTPSGRPAQAQFPKDPSLPPPAAPGSPETHELKGVPSDKGGPLTQ